MTVAALITEGIGPGGSIPFLLTGGLAQGQSPITIVDTHDDWKKRKRWKDESEAKDRRKAEILAAYERIVEEKPDIAREIASQFVPKSAKAKYVLPPKAMEKMVADPMAAQRIWEAYIEMDDEEVLRLL